MRIPVNIEVGCEVRVYKGWWDSWVGKVESQNQDGSYVVRSADLCENNVKSHSISEFTFGGVWVTNTEFDSSKHKGFGY